MNKKNIFIINNSLLKNIVGGVSENSSGISKNNKSKIGMAVDAVFIVTGMIIGGCSGVSGKYSTTETTSYDGNGRKSGSQKHVTKGFKTPSIGMMGVYSAAGALIGHKIANIITKNF